MMNHTLFSFFLLLVSLHANAAKNGFSDWETSTEYTENTVSRKLYVNGNVACTQFKLFEQHHGNTLARKWDSGCQKYKIQLMREAAEKNLSASSHSEITYTSLAKSKNIFF